MYTGHAHTVVTTATKALLVNVKVDVSKATSGVTLQPRRSVPAGTLGMQVEPME